ncbi:MAG: cation-translocating P-type ATPase [Acidimicrobiia bacterium]
MSAPAVEAAFATDAEGLSAEEVSRRLGQFGPNQLEEEPPTPAIVVLGRQFRSPLIYVLVAATAVTGALEEYIDAAVIAAVLALNAVIGFTQERKAEGAVRALMQLVVPHARVVRGGQEWEIDSRELVPGDVVLLEPGARVAGDLRLTAANGLQVDESLLTGESSPVTKRTTAVSEGAPLADRTSMVYTGSVVTSGRGRGVSVATGGATELGAIAGLIRSEVATETPLQRRMAGFAKIVGLAVGVASLVAFASGVAFGGSFEDMFLIAVALAVAAIPEGLPVVFTITLALGVRRMARRNAIVRRLPAVETLGSTTVICSDKTGTLTENRMTVQQVWTGGCFYTVGESGAGMLVDGEPASLEERPGLHHTLLAGVLTNEAEAYRTDDGLHLTGDPTEAALLVSAMAAGIEPDEARDAYPVFAEIPFEPDRRYSASLRSRHGTHVLFVKGAPERVADMCTEVLTQTGRAPIDRDGIHDASRRMAEAGLRVLAMAYRELPRTLDDPGELTEPDELVFLGLQGMMDPPRHGVADAVAACHTAGIRVVMITGDHAITAGAIAHRIGIAGEDAELLTGRDLEQLSDDELQQRVGNVSIYARVSPEDKLRIVRALHKLGDVVAVTGDGVNDAPALKAASIGIAMGRAGTDVAREAADMVLADDNFVSIAAAVEEGRITFDNVRKVTFFLVSTGVATIAAILFGVWAQWPLLMLPAQLLWLNLVTNGLQDVALAFEPGEKATLQRPPRPTREGVVSRLLWERALIAGLVMAAGTLALFRWELDRTGSLERAQTVALTTMVVYMAFHVGNARSESTSLFRLSPFSNRFLFVATVTALAVHVASLYLPPTQYVLRVEPIEMAAWMRIVAVAASILVAMELHKLIRRRDTIRVSGDGTTSGAPPFIRLPRLGGHLAPVLGDETGDGAPAAERPRDGP